MQILFIIFSDLDIKFLLHITFAIWQLKFREKNLCIWEINIVFK